MRIGGLVVLIYSLVVFMQGLDSGFISFFRNWPALYQEGLVRGAEWRARRFEWF
jgi:inner membrane protein